MPAHRCSACARAPQPVPEPGHLGLEGGPVAGVVEDVVGLLDPLLPRDLGPDAGLGVGPVEAALGQQPLEGDLGRGVHDHDLVQLDRLAVERGEQGDGQDDDVVGVGQGVARLDHGDADGRMRDGVELQPRLLVGEGDRGQGLAVDRPVGGEDPGSEAVDQRLVGRPTRGHDVAGHLVGVDEHGAPLDQQVGHGRLARADATRQADRQHHRAAGRRRRRGARATAKRTSVVSSRSSVTNQSSAVMPVAPPASLAGHQLVGQGQQAGVGRDVPRVGNAVADVEDVEPQELVAP